MRSLVSRTAAAAGTLAAIGLATPVVALVLVPGLPLVLAAVALYQWRADRP